MPLIRPDFSPLFLPPDGELHRRPRWGWGPRSSHFRERFEARALFYDCFWAAAGSRVLLVGPAPYNLMRQHRAARFHAEPSGTALDARLYPSRSVMLTELGPVPPSTEAIGVEIAGIRAMLPIQPSLAGPFAGRRVLFSMNRNNELPWIEDWARYHATMHGTDAVILFDNGSTLYPREAVEERLARVPGLKLVSAPSWPWAFGALDRNVAWNRFWAHFLQISSMTEVLRRFAPQAQGILNADVDELVTPVPGGSIYDLAQRSDLGLVGMKGQWVEAETHASTTSHQAFQHRLVDRRRDLAAPKWVLDPQRAWVERLDVFPYWHKVKGAPNPRGEVNPEARFWHFKGINTNWKQRRTRGSMPDPRRHEEDVELAAAFAAYSTRKLAVEDA